MNKVKYLLTYRYSEIISDLTVQFCQKYILSYLGNLSPLRRPDRRTADQMIQAARSCKQNIVEGVGQSATSKKGEIKLLGVAKASVEELLADYEDFLRQNQFLIWPLNDKRILYLRRLAFSLSHLSNLSNLGNFIKKPRLFFKPEPDANFLLTLCHQETFLLTKQVSALEKKFIKEGGFSENLLKNRIKQKCQRKV